MLAKPELETQRPRRLAWAALLKRTFGLDVMCCPKCGGRMKIVAVVQDPRADRAVVRPPGGADAGAGGAAPAVPGADQVGLRGGSWRKVPVGFGDAAPPDGVSPPAPVEWAARDMQGDVEDAAQRQWDSVDPPVPAD